MRFRRDPHLILRRVGDCFVAYHERSGETVILHDLAFQTLEILKSPLSFESVFRCLELTNIQYDSEKEIVDFVRSVFDEMLKHRFVHEVEL
jgi:hypothetical protein